MVVPIQFVVVMVVVVAVVVALRRCGAVVTVLEHATVTNSAFLPPRYRPWPNSEAPVGWALPFRKVPASYHRRMESK